MDDPVGTGRNFPLGPFVPYTDDDGYDPVTGLLPYFLPRIGDPDPAGRRAISRSVCT